LAREANPFKQAGSKRDHLSEDEVARRATPSVLARARARGVALVGWTREVLPADEAAGEGEEAFVDVVAAVGADQEAA
jgi:hypothetical protein